MKPKSKSASAIPTRGTRKQKPGDALFRDNPLAMWVYDAQTLTFLDVNRAALKVCGYSKTEFLQLRLPDIALDPPQPDNINPARPGKNGYKEHLPRMKICRKDGSVLVQDVVTKALQYDGHEARVATLNEPNDVGKYLLPFLHGARDPMLVSDQQGKIVLVNEQLEKQFGYTADQLIGKAVEMLLPKRFRAAHPKYRADFFSNYQQATVGVGRELWAVARDGSEFPVEISLSTVDAEQGLLVLVTIRDITERKQFEAALLRSEKNLAEAQALAHLGSHEYDVSTGLLHWSDQVFEIFGIQPADFHGTTAEFLDRIHPDDRQRVTDTINRAIAERVPCVYEHRIVRPNGEVRVVQERFVPYFDEQGVHIRSVGTVQDVTDRQTTREVLNYADTIIGTSPVGILTCKSTGEIVSANDAVAQMIGAPVQNWLHTNFRHLESWQQSGLLAAAETALSTGIQQDVEAHGVSTYGREFWFFARMSPFAYGDETHLLVMLSDILAQKQTQHALEQSEARYRDLVENTQVLMCTHDLEGRILSINPWALRVLGYSSEDVIGKGIQDLLAPDMLHAFQRYLRQIKKQGAADGVLRVTNSFRSDADLGIS